MFAQSGLSSDDVRQVLRITGRNEKEINQLITDAINNSEATANNGRVTLLMDVESFTYSLYVH